MPLIYWNIYTDSEQFGQIDRQNLSIREMDFVQAMIENWKGLSSK